MVVESVTLFYFKTRQEKMRTLKQEEEIKTLYKKNEDMPIIIDSREQRPYDYDNAITKKLDTGDYSIKHFENEVCVERKSMDDLVNTLLNHTARFDRELLRMQFFPHSCIVVEGSLMDLMTGSYTSAVSAPSILGMAMRVNISFKIPIIYCTNRICAKRYTEDFLKKSVRELINGW